MKNKVSTTLDDIKRYIEEGEMSFLIGAGFSRNVNKDAYPLWGGLLKDAIWNLFGNGNRAKQEEKVVAKTEKEYGYLGIASMLVKKAGYHEAIDTYIEGKTPYLKSVDKKDVLILNGKQLPNTVNPECHLLLKKLNIQNIYTFNYDNALEYFLGEEARLELENEITKLEDKIEALRNARTALREKEESLDKLINAKHEPERNDPSADVSEDETEKISDAEKIKEELNTTRQEIFENRAKELDLISALETKKQSRRTFYNVVKDSYDISLSAKRKSIYKIHGSLRENAEAEYGFDGDTHTQYIITQEDYDTYNEKHSAFVSMMRIDLLRSRFCIMGVSGGDANFLAWINWVKDVLDKTNARSGQKNEEKHLSYFIYSSSDDMPQEMKLMLRNHFIEPVILKDLFPDGKNDEERIKKFLEYVQPLNNDEVSKFSDLWSSIEVPRMPDKGVKKVKEQVAETLFQLSGVYRFHSPKSAVRYVAKDVQFASRIYLRKDAAEEERKLYAAALRCSLLPLDLTCGKMEIEQMDDEKNPSVRKAFVDAFRRMVLLQNISVKEDELKKGYEYSEMLQNIYCYQFPTVDDVKKIGGDTGLDRVRRYSLIHLLRGKGDDMLNCEASDFGSPQEFVLAMDWMKFTGYKNPALYRRADEYRFQNKLLSLSDYSHAYLDGMKRKQETNTYGNVVETLYLDKYTSDVINGSILLNSYIELGICFAGHTLLEDNEWIEIVRALKTRYTEVLIFYTIARNSKDNVIKVVAQEMMYDEGTRKVLDRVLKNQIRSLDSDTTPNYIKSRVAKFAKEILVAVDARRWSASFVANAEKILDSAERCGFYSDAKKSMYAFVTEALDYVNAKELRLRLVKRVLDKDEINDRFEDHYNSLVIAARKKLKPSDFEDSVSKLADFAEKAKASNSLQAYFVVLNLLTLIKKEEKPKLLAIIEYRAIRNAFMTEGYAAHAKDYPELALSFKEKFVQGEDFWHSGITNEGVHIGVGTVGVNRLDRALHFNEEQVRILYNDVKTFIVKMDNILQKEEQTKVDRGWMSSENTFREQVMDMRLFMCKHQQELKGEADYENTIETLKKVYEQCFFNKDVYQLIAEDEIYKAVRRIMVETEMFGIENYRLEYEQLIGRIIAKETTELGIAFRHVSWAMKHYSRFFNTEDFKKLFIAVLKIYEPYFKVSVKEQRAWDLIGSQKEIAERCLMSISKTLESWGYYDAFWSKYKKVFNYKD